MSKMGDLLLEIQDLIEQGVEPSLISSTLDIPLDFVMQVYDDMANIKQME
jgi:hypothetical protein